MAAIKKDVNFTLVALILATVIVLIGFTVYFQKMFKNLATDYEEKVTNLEKVTQELGMQRTKLNKTTLEFSEERQSFDDLSTRYGELRDAKTILEDEKTALSKKLNEQTADLLRADAEAKKKEVFLSQCQKSLREANDKNTILKLKEDSCEDNLNVCHTQLDICQG